MAASFWAWVWGPIGLILATPLTLCLVVMGRHVKRLEFLDVMLGDRPALTPVESFYQRILAGDAAEARDHAETLLRDSSLSTYYDEVALKGLQLAANDAGRGVLDGAQLDRIRTTVHALVDGLASHDDGQPRPARRGKGVAGHDGPDLPAEAAPKTVRPANEALPPNWRGPGAVLCIAGHGPLDEAASGMLVQLLGKHGLGGRLVGHDAIGRDRIATLDAAGVAMACVSYLDISGDLTHLHDLVGRLRGRLPAGTPILVGLWPTQASTLEDGEVRRAVGADHFTSSLAEAVSACVDAARDGNRNDTNVNAANVRAIGAA